MPDRIEGRAYEVAAGPFAGSVPAVLLWSDADIAWVGDVAGSRWIVSVDETTGAVTEAGGAVAGSWAGAIDGRELIGPTYGFIPEWNGADVTINSDRFVACFVIGMTSGMCVCIVFSVCYQFTLIYRPLARM